MSYALSYTPVASSHRKLKVSRLGQGARALQERGEELFPETLWFYLCPECALPSLENLSGADSLEKGTVCGVGVSGFLLTQIQRKRGTEEE